jgi:hypothetical protein
MKRDLSMIIVPALLVATVLASGEAAGRAEDGGSPRTRSSGTYQPPVDRSPEVLCGCLEVLKNFA